MAVGDHLGRAPAVRRHHEPAPRLALHDHLAERLGQQRGVQQHVVPVYQLDDLVDVPERVDAQLRVLAGEPQDPLPRAHLRRTTCRPPR